MADFYFFKTLPEKGRNRLRPLTGQTLDGVNVDITLNVQSDRTIRTLYPLGTVFGSTGLKLCAGFYEVTSNIYPLGLRDDEYKVSAHRPPEAMQRAYETFIGAITGSHESEESLHETTSDKDSLLSKMMRNDIFNPPSIKKGGFYVDQDNWYLLLRNISNQVNTMMIGPTGTGKCLGYDTPVLMYDGSIEKVQNIMVGDKLMGPDSKPRNVLSVTTGVEELYRVTPKRGHSWVCNKSHILSLKKSDDGSGNSGEVVNVGIEEYLSWNKSRKRSYKQWRTGVEFEESPIMENPYDVGFETGQFNLTFIEEQYLVNSREVRLQVLAGLADSDLCKGGNCFTFQGINKGLSKDLEYLSRSLGLYATTTVSEEGKLRTVVSGDLTDVPTKVPGKNIGAKPKQDPLTTSFTLESIGEGDYYGFTIDGDHLFMLGDFTVTHNTELVMLACKALDVPCHVYDMGSMYDPISGLLGVHRLQKGGVSTFDYAKFTEDISKPGVVLLDELSRAPVTTNNILFPCLDSRRMLPVEIAGGEDLRSVKVHDECCFIATANVGAEYTGTMSMDRALVGRFFPLELDYMPKDREEEVLIKRCHIGRSAAQHIVAVANNIRSLYRKQELSCSLSTRETLMAAELVADGWNVLRAMELVFLPLFEGTRAEGERGIINKSLMSR